MRRTLRTRRSALSLLAHACVAFLMSAPAQAQIPVAPLQSALGQLPDAGKGFYARYTGAGGDASAENSRLPLLLRLRSGKTPPAGAVHVVNDLYVVAAGPGRITALSAKGKLALSSIRTPRMSLANPRVRANDALVEYGLDGSGSVVGIVDTGADLTHPALRNGDGSTRVLWLLAYGQEPRGTHPDLEEAYGCLGEEPCAIYDQNELNEILLDDPTAGELPRDVIGHGTHIASIAAGRDADYPGIAPGADLIVVAAADETGGVFDSRILIGTRFIFDRARA